VREREKREREGMGEGKGIQKIYKLEKSEYERRDRKCLCVRDG